MRHSSPETKRRYQLGSFIRFESTSNERMKGPIKDVIRYIFVTVAILRKSRELRSSVTN
jgi:hypothetical protein